MISSISTSTSMIQPAKMDRDISFESKIQESSSEKVSGVVSSSEMANETKTNSVSAITESIGSIIDTRV